jgi:23S rRNA pseudouridine1911/1915/1917 synthase
VPLKSEGLSLAAYLSSRFTYYSEENWGELVKAKRIFLNNNNVEAQHSVKAGDEIKYYAEYRPEPKVPTKIPIVYEDADLIVVNKPAHLPVHPSGRYMRNTLIHLLKAQKKTEMLFLAHRIDRETSGLCVLTKTTLAKEKMYWAFFEGEVEKKYWALTWGRPEPATGTIQAPIGQPPKGSPHHKIRIRQLVGGVDSKRATTKYKCLQTNWIHSFWMPPPWDSLKRQASEIKSKKAFPVSLIEAKPITGRTNQIRVHMAHIGCGLLGDKLYDPSEEIFIELTQSTPLLENEAGTAGFRLPAHLRPRLVLDAHALHARFLSFKHPRSGQILRLEAPAPKEWAGLYRSNG